MALEETHPRRLAVKAVVESPLGQQIIMKACEEGQPATCAIDELLRAIVVGYGGTDYGSVDEISFTGATISNFLKAKGYVNVGKMPCPEGCAAGQGAVWTKP